MAQNPSHVITIFRNRLKESATEEYAALSPSMTDLARGMSGFIDAKTFVAPDGERVTVVTFADQVAHEAWRDHPAHREAQQRGIEEFYSEYSIQVGTVSYSNRFASGTSQ
jgi:heme-degrading monooxygenase HmoA